jgi:hypothetical protein
MRREALFQAYRRTTSEGSIIVNSIVVRVHNWAVVVEKIVGVEALPRRGNGDRLKLTRVGEGEGSIQVGLNALED